MKLFEFLNFFCKLIYCSAKPDPTGYGYFFLYGNVEDTVDRYLMKLSALLNALLLGLAHLTFNKIRYYMALLR